MSNNPPVFTVSWTNGDTQMKETFQRGPERLTAEGRMVNKRLGVSINYKCDDPAESWWVSIGNDTDSLEGSPERSDMVEHGRNEAEAILSSMLHFRKNWESIIDVLQDLAFETMECPRADLLRMLCCRPLSTPKNQLNIVMKILADSRAFGDLTRITEVEALSDEARYILVDVLNEMTFKDTTDYPEDWNLFILSSFRILDHTPVAL